jgi:hypothetical protein
MTEEKLFENITFDEINVPEGYIKGNLENECYREYVLPNVTDPYRIDEPVALITRPGGTTHRIVDSRGVVHCVPHKGAVIRWFNNSRTNPCNW